MVQQESSAAAQQEVSVAVNQEAKKGSAHKKKKKNSRENLIDKPQLINEQTLLDLKLEMENFQIYICKKLDILNDALLNNDSCGSETDSDTCSSGDSVVTKDNSCVSDECFDDFENYIMGGMSVSHDSDSDQVIKSDK